MTRKERTNPQDERTRRQVAADVWADTADHMLGHLQTELRALARASDATNEARLRRAIDQTTDVRAKLAGISGRVQQLRWPRIS